MEELTIDNILLEDDLENILVDDLEILEGEDPSTTPSGEDGEKETKEKKETGTNDEGEGLQESVVSKEIELETGKEDTTSNSESSPKFYSSIANALKEDGIFPDLDEETLKTIKAPEDFAAIIEQQIKNQLDVRQQRIDEALNVGVEPTEIKNYEDTLNYLDSIDNSSLSEESDSGELLRKKLIYQDFLNRGYSKERAEREVNKSFNAGSDIEDALEALQSNREYFKSEYNDLIKEAKEEAVRQQKETEKMAADLKKSILEDDKIYGDISIDKTTRQKIYDSISKPIHKDKESGELLTELQKYEKENKSDFIKNVGLLFTLTDGFKNLDKLVNTKVNRKLKQGLRELEHTLNNTSRTTDGNIKFASGVSDDPESFIGKTWDLDV